jgi:leucyl aminopeptidase
MKFEAKSGNPAVIKTQCLILPVYTRKRLSDVGKQLDQASDRGLSAVLRRGDIDGKAGQTLMLYQQPGIAAERLLLVGCGAKADFDGKALIEATKTAVRLLQKARPQSVLNLLVADMHGDAAATYYGVRDTVVATTAETYQFTACKSEASTPSHPLRSMQIWLPKGASAAAANKAIEHGQGIGDGMALTRELADLPGNICTPSYLADRARQAARGLRKLRVQVLEEKDMQALGMGALLSVSRGSRQPAKLIVMHYKGAPAKNKPVALVGKGLTFDAGGISIKPSADMDEMKYDMCGGASVIGTLLACARMDLPLNVVGVVPSSENLPDGDANKPGDIVTSMSGQTIEILNTDAEGRLILCDALTYTERFEPSAVIDVATLTGACIIALGNQAAGLLANDDKLAQQVLEAGERSGDRAWQLPLWDEYQKQLDSNFADMANIGGRGAGTITAACFLSRFAKAFKWVHLDIAGIAWLSGKEKGATGRPVPLLTQFLIRRAGQAE